MVFTGDPTLLNKLNDVETKVDLITPTTAAGTRSPRHQRRHDLAARHQRQVNSSGGLKLVQTLSGGPTTKITLGSIGVDLAAKTASVEVIGESNAESEGKKPLNVGNLGRSSIADLTISSVMPSPATRTVTVSASGTIQPVAAEVLEGFVKVYEGSTPRWLRRPSKKKSQKGKKPPMSEAEIVAAGAKAAEAKWRTTRSKRAKRSAAFSFTATGE